MQLRNVTAICKDERHHAFTDLCRYAGKLLVAFRSASTHHSMDGVITLLQSGDGKSWHRLAQLSEPDTDLRDPKLVPHPDGRLALYSAAVTEQDGGRSTQTVVYFSDNGSDWQGPIAIGEPNIWIWRIRWHAGSCYGIGYACNKGSDFIRLYRSKDGVNFEAVSERIYNGGYPNESDMVFLEDGAAVLLLRRDGADSRSAMLGISRHGLTQWDWHDLGVAVGGPVMEVVPGLGIVVATREFVGDGIRTVVSLLDHVKHELSTVLPLPSAGDTSYPGMVVEGERLWLSYYSSHEGSSAIYLAELSLASA
jgi:hypothetical protein